MFETAADNNYDPFMMTISDQDPVVFVLRACSAISVALSEIPGITQSATYEIRIGSEEHNDDVQIWSDGEKKKETRVSDAMPCDSHRYFWVSWTEGLIKVGRERNIGQITMLAWQDNEPHEVHGLSVASNGKTASWHFGETRGENKFVFFNSFHRVIFGFL